MFWPRSRLKGSRGRVTEIAAAHDFYASPRLSADGKQAGVPRLGSSGHAVGQRCAVRVGCARRRPSQAAEAYRRRRWQRAVSAGMGPRRSPLFHLGQDRLGASLSLERYRNCSRAWFRRRRALAAAVGVRHALLCAASRRALRCRFGGAWHAAPGHRQAHRRTHRCFPRVAGKNRAHRRPVGRRRRLRRAGELAGRDAGRHEVCAGRRASDCRTAAGSHRARIRQPWRGACVQEREAADGVRHPLPAGEPEPPRAEGCRRRRPWCWRMAGPRA